jgi:hypothetical protein
MAISGIIDLVKEVTHPSKNPAVTNSLHLSPSALASEHYKSFDCSGDRDENADSFPDLSAF